MVVLGASDRPHHIGIGHCPGGGGCPGPPADSRCTVEAPRDPPPTLRVHAWPCFPPPCPDVGRGPGSPRCHSSELRPGSRPGPAP